LAVIFVKAQIPSTRASSPLRPGLRSRHTQVPVVSTRRGVEGKLPSERSVALIANIRPLKPPGDTAILPTRAEVAFTVGQVGLLSRDYLVQ